MKSQIKIFQFELNTVITPAKVFVAQTKFYVIPAKAGISAILIIF